MKILILSVTAGQGHNQCGLSIMKQCEDRGIQCQMVDSLEYVSHILADGVSKGYLVSTKYSPGAYGKVYGLLEKKNKPQKSFTISKVVFRKLGNFVNRYNPDAIICTHIFAAKIITAIKDINCPTIGIITDFTIHPFWEDAIMDYYVTASELLNLQLIKKGIPAEKALPVGIPINEKFSKEMSKSEARKIVGIDDKLTVLVMSGSMGYGNIIKQIKGLNKLDIDMQIITVCGNNAQLKKRIDNLVISKKIINFGFTNNVDILMDCADCVVTKPGGLTVSEALAKKVPLVLFDPIPGQEDRNMEFLLNNGAALRVSNTYPLDECLYELLSSQRRLEHMEQDIKCLSKPNSTKDLIDFIEKISKDGE